MKTSWVLLTTPEVGQSLCKGPLQSGPVLCERKCARPLSAKAEGIGNKIDIDKSKFKTSFQALTIKKCARIKNNVL